MVADAGTSAAASLAGARLAILLASLELGGAERQALLLAAHLRHACAAEVMVFGMGAPGRVSASCDELRIPWRSVPRVESRWSVLSWLRMRRLAAQMRPFRPELILPFTMPANVAAALTLGISGARACVWNQRDEGLARFAPWLERGALARAGACIANSEAAAAVLVGLGVVAPRITVIPNAVALPAAGADRQAWRRRLDADEGCLVATMVANLGPNKDHGTLLAAWKQVVDRLAAGGRRALLVLAGRRDAACAVLVALAERLALQRSVVFLGAIDDVAGLLAASDLGVFSSRSEGCPNGVLECMASGLAVAASDIAGIRAVLGAEAQPWLAAPGDATELARRIIALADDAGTRVAAGASNRVRAQEVFAPQRMFAATTAVIAAALARRSGGGDA